MKKEKQEFFINHLSTITNNIINKIINENKNAYFEKDILGNIFEKKRE